ncbi:MAG: hypothetical protein KFW07_03190 [Mycoplasmataceae bacterium]|nr:hypothetical protein [Mycoplasmataceae bacterium]
MENKINKDNYHLSTRGAFKILGLEENLNKNKILKDCEFSYQSNESTYFINNETNELIRISNHWGIVGSCYWIIEISGEIRKQCKEYNEFNNKTPFLVGIIKLEELMENK